MKQRPPSAGPAGSPSARALILTGLLAGVILVAAVIVYYGTGVATGRQLFFTHDIGGSDIWHLNYPMKHFYQKELAEGRMPLWCPEIGTGFPLHAEGQVAALYPLNLLLFGLLPLDIAFNWGILLHAILSGVFAAMLARQLGANRGGSVVAAIVFAFSGFFVTHLKHINMTASAVWIPLLLLLLERYAANRSRKTLALFAAVVGATVLAGHPQIVYNNLLVAGGYALYLLVRIWRRRPIAGGGAGNAARFGGGLLYAVVLGVMLGAPQILPTNELNQVGPRSGGLPLKEATEWEYRPRYLGAFLLPSAWGVPGQLRAVPATDPRTGQPIVIPETGERPQELVGFEQDPEHRMLYWEMTGYVGLLPIALLVVCLVLGYRRGTVWMLVTFLVLSLLLTLGKNGGLFYLFYHVVPGFNLFRFHDRFLLYAGLALALLAGTGVTLVAARLPAGSRRFTGAALAVGVGVVGFIDLWIALGQHNPKVAAERWTTPPDTVVRIRKAEASGSGDLFRVVENDPTRSVFTNAYYLARGWRGDLAPYDPARLLLDPNYNLLFGITNIHTYYQIYPRWMMKAMELLTIPGNPYKGQPPYRINPPIASLYNVKYVLDPFQAHDGVFPLMAEYDGGRRLLGSLLVDHPQSPFKIRLYRNPQVMERAFLVPRARILFERPARPGQATEAQRALVDRAFDPRRELLLHQQRGDPPVLGGIPGEPIPGGVRFEEYGPQRVRLTVDAPRDCWLFLSDTYYPGWVATVDGIATPIHRADICGRAVAVKAGRHEVVFAYAPSSFRNGLIIALLGIVLLATLALQVRLVARIRFGQAPPRGS